MSRKALGRGLADLLRRAKPARPVDRAVGSDTQAPDAHPPDSTDEPLELPLPFPPEPSSSDASPAPASQLSRIETNPAHHRPDLHASPPLPTELHRPRSGDASADVTPQSPKPPPTGPARSSISFGTPYGTTPPGPTTSPNPVRWFLFAADALLLLFAGALVLGPWVPRPLSLYLAGAAVLLGALLAVFALIRGDPPPANSPDSKQGSRVRVRLTRL